MEWLGSSIEKGSDTATPVAWPTMLMTDDKNADACAYGTIHKRVWEPTQGIHAQLAFGGRAETRIADKQTGDAGELCKKGRRQGDSRLLLVEGGCGGEFDFSFGMKPIAHARLARMRATASSPGTEETAPLSISASLR